MNANNECDFEMLLSHNALTWTNTIGLYMYYHIIVRHISTITDDTATAGDGKQRVVRHAIILPQQILSLCNNVNKKWTNIFVSVIVKYKTFHNLVCYILSCQTKNRLKTINCLQHNPLVHNIPVKYQQGF